MRTLLPAQISSDNFKAHSHSLTSRGAHASINSGREQAIKSLVKYALKHQHARFLLPAQCGTVNSSRRSRGGATPWVLKIQHPRC